MKEVKDTKQIEKEIDDLNIESNEFTLKNLIYQYLILIILIA